MSGDSFIVAVRIRPQSQAESNAGSRPIIVPVSTNTLVFDPPNVALAKPQPGLAAHGRNKDIHYAFDRVFDASTNQADVYAGTAAKVVGRVLDGYNATVFAYGATSAGKTWTMVGSAAQPGIMIRTMRDVFQQIEELRAQRQFNVSLSYLEIYNEQIRDLLSLTPSSQPLALREERDGSMTIAGLSSHSPHTAEEVFSMLERGNTRRTQSATEANAQSSRSHAVLQVTIRSSEITSGTHSRQRVAKLSLIDLAGSERAAVSKNRGQTLKEGANINRSLLALGNCINQLAARAKQPVPSKDSCKSTTGKENITLTKSINQTINLSATSSFVPYRDSKLTRLLKDSLGGRALTVMIANVSPSSINAEDSHNTLKYANRAKDIQCAVVKQDRPVSHHVTQLEQMIQQLKLQADHWKSKYEDVVKSPKKASTNQACKANLLSPSAVKNWRDQCQNHLLQRSHLEHTITQAKCELVKLNGSMAVLTEQRDAWNNPSSDPFNDQSITKTPEVQSLIESINQSIEQLGAQRLQLLATLQRSTSQLNERQQAMNVFLTQLRDPSVSASAGSNDLALIDSQASCTLSELANQSSQATCDAYSQSINDLRQRWKLDNRALVTVIQSFHSVYQSIDQHQQLLHHETYQNALKAAVSTTRSISQPFPSPLPGSSMRTEDLTNLLMRPRSPPKSPLSKNVSPRPCADQLSTTNSEFSFRYASAMPRPSELPDARFSSARSTNQFFTSTTSLASSAQQPDESGTTTHSSGPLIKYNHTLFSNANGPNTSIATKLTQPLPRFSSLQSILASSSLNNGSQQQSSMMHSSVAEEGDEDMSDAVLMSPATNQSLKQSTKTVRRLSGGQPKKYRALDPSSISSAFSKHTISSSSEPDHESESISTAHPRPIRNKENLTATNPSRHVNTIVHSVGQATKPTVNVVPSGLARLLRPARPPITQSVQGLTANTPLKKRPLVTSRLRTPTTNSAFGSSPAPSSQRKAAMRI